MIHTDNGTEITNQTLKDYADEIGITFEPCNTYTPQQNGSAERSNRTLMNGRVFEDKDLDDAQSSDKETEDKEEENENGHQNSSENKC